MYQDVRFPLRVWQRSHEVVRRALWQDLRKHPAVCVMHHSVWLCPHMWCNWTLKLLSSESGLRHRWRKQCKPLIIPTRDREMYIAASVCRKQDSWAFYLLSIREFKNRAKGKGSGGICWHSRDDLVPVCFISKTSHHCLWEQPSVFECAIVPNSSSAERKRWRWLPVTPKPRST